jgi:hypothetical protein
VANVVNRRSNHIRISVIVVAVLLVSLLGCRGKCAEVAAIDDISVVDSGDVARYAAQSTVELSPLVCRKYDGTESKHRYDGGKNHGGLQVKIARLEAGLFIFESNRA